MWMWKPWNLGMTYNRIRWNTAVDRSKNLTKIFGSFFIINFLWDHSTFAPSPSTFQRRVITIFPFTGVLYDFYKIVKNYFSLLTFDARSLVSSRQCDPSWVLGVHWFTTDCVGVGVVSGAASTSSPQSRPL